MHQTLFPFFLNHPKLSNKTTHHTYHSPNPPSHNQVRSEQSLTYSTSTRMDTSPRTKSSRFLPPWTSIPLTRASLRSLVKLTSMVRKCWKNKFDLNDNDNIICIAHSSQSFVCLKALKAFFNYVFGIFTVFLLN